MHQMLNKMYRDLANDDFRPTLIVGLARGGLVPAVHFSHYFNVEMIAVKYSLRDFAGKDPLELVRAAIQIHSKILVVDDICDEGHTLKEFMKEIREIYEERWNGESDYSYGVRTAVLQHNLGSTLFDPTYCGEEINKVEKPEWIVYPYEY